MGAYFKEYSNVCHYIAYSFGRTGLLDFSLFTGCRPDLLRGAPVKVTVFFTELYAD